MSKLLEFVNDNENPQRSFELGLWYESLGHVAAAAGLYLRAAENSTGVLSYEALLRMANCFVIQGDLLHVIKGVLLRAISLCPSRPEAYFLLSRVYERNKEWHEAYTFAVMGQRFDVGLPLQTYVDYPGEYALVFQQAVAAWWIGLFEESISLLKKLDNCKKISPVYAIAVSSNLYRLTH